METIVASPHATSREETVAFLSTGPDSVCTIITQPTVRANGVGVVLLHGGGWQNSVAANRMWVRLARRLAADGFTVARFDFHGVGDSTGVVEEFRLDQPFTADLGAVCRRLHADGINRFALVGTCLGSRTALAFAAEHDAVEAVVLTMPPVRDLRRGDDKVQYAAHIKVRSYVRAGLRWHVWNRLRDPKWRDMYRRALVAKSKQLTGRATPADDPTASFSTRMHFELATLADRGVPMLLIYGDHDMHFREFEQYAAAPLAPLLQGSPGSIELRTMNADHELHGFPSLDSQAAMIDQVPSWLIDKCAVG
jgi:uncharacterized protein